MNDKLRFGPHNSKRVDVIQEESKEYSEKSMNNNLEAENEMNASTSKDICHKMMQKINQQSLENQLADYILRSD